MGEPVLLAMGVPLLAFQIAGGIVLFLFTLTMISGESKPEGETEMLRGVQDTAIFPLATPSIASPGAMMAVVLLTESQTHRLLDQVATAVIMLLVVSMVFGLMRIAGTISRLIGNVLCPRFDMHGRGNRHERHAAGKSIYNVPSDDIVRLLPVI